MKQGTFYFPHDYNARMDDKIKTLIRRHGMQGYGLFWAIIEDLYNNNNELTLSIDGISYDLRVDESLVKSVIYDFNLFKFEGDKFGSISIEKRISDRNDRSIKARDNAVKRWGNDNKRTPAIDHIFYVLRMYNETESFIKFGITGESVSRRYSGKTPYKYDLIISCETSCENALEYERNFKKLFAKYTPLLKFGGYLECLEINELDAILNFAMLDEKLRNAIKEKKVKESKVKEKKEGEAADAPHPLTPPPIEYSIEQKESFTKFQNWIIDNAPRVAKMKEPFTISQYLSLVKKGFTPEKIRTTLADMHNWTPLLTKNQSAYLTLTKWTKKDQI